MCSSPPRSWTIVGSAVATIVLSSAASSSTSMSPEKTTPIEACARGAATGCEAVTARRRLQRVDDQISVLNLLERRATCRTAPQWRRSGQRSRSQGVRPVARASGYSGGACDTGRPRSRTVLVAAGRQPRPKTVLVSRLRLPLRVHERAGRGERLAGLQQRLE